MSVAGNPHLSNADVAQENQLDAYTLRHRMQETLQEMREKRLADEKAEAEAAQKYVCVCGLTQLCKCCCGPQAH